jgi:hypothetical protein
MTIALTKIFYQREVYVRRINVRMEDASGSTSFETGRRQERVSPFMLMFVDWPCH